MCGGLAIGEQPGAVTMGEGYSATAEQPARYVHRAFTVPDVPKICDAAPLASRIEFDKDTMTLRVGDSFGLDDIPSAAAYDGNGVVGAVVPVFVERTSGHESVDWSGQDQRWYAIAPGEVEVTVSGACPKHQGLRAVLTIVIRSPSPEESSERIEGSTTDGNGP